MKTMNYTAQLDEMLFDDEAAEHITISSDCEEDDIARDSSGIAVHCFSQSSRAHKETREFSIVDERFLAVTVDKPRTDKKRYQFNLAFLDPTPRRFSGVAWRWLYISLILAGMSIVAFSVSSMSVTALLEQRWLPVNVLMVVASTMSFLMFLYRTNFSLTFHSLHGRAPLVELLAKNPNRGAVEEFVRELQKRIEAARQSHWQDKPQILRDELRMHCRLWEEGVLPDEVYEGSKVRILAEHG